MADIVTFVLHLQDMMSGGVRKVAATTRSAFGEIDRTVAATQRYMDKLGEEKRLRVNTDELDEAHRKMDGVMSKWEVMKGTMMGEVAIRLGTRAWEFGKNFIGESITGGMEEARVKMQMRVMAGDQGGMERYEEIHKNLLRGMYGPQLYVMGKTMTALGMSQEAMMKRLSQFEDIAGGDKGNLAQLAQSYAEFKSVGRVSNIRMLMPLSEMGFNPGAVLAEKYGVSLQKGNEMLADEKNGFKRFEEALDTITGVGGRMHDMQKRLMETGTGKIFRAQTNWENTKHEFGEQLLPTIGRLLDRIKPIADRLPVLLERLVPPIERLGNNIINLIDWVSKNTATIGTLIKTTETLIKAYIFYQGAAIVKSAAGAFMQGLSGAGGGALAGGLATGAGELAAGSAAGMMGLLTSTAGMAAIAFVAFEMYEKYKSMPGADAYDAKKLSKTFGAGNEYSPDGGSTGTDVAGRVGAQLRKLWKDSQKASGVDFSAGWQDRLGKQLEENGKGGKEKMPKGAADALSETGAAVVGGGGKSVILNFNAPFYKVDKQILQNMTEAVKDFEGKVVDVIWRIMPSLPA